MNLPQEKFIKTAENWYPTKKDGTFRVKILKFHEDQIGKNERVKELSTKYRVCCWGEDDFGLEKDVYTLKEAKIMYDKITDYITQYELKVLMGFWPA